MVPGYDDTEIWDAVGKKMVKHILDYDGTHIKEDGENLTFAVLYEMLMEKPDFCVLVYNNYAYHPNGVSTSQIVFSSEYPVNGYDRAHRITMLANGTVTATETESEHTSSRVNAITEANEGSTVQYPSVKGVADYVKPIKQGLTQLAEAKPGTITAELKEDLYTNAPVTTDVLPVPLNPSQYLAWGVSGSTAEIGMEAIQRISSYQYHGLRELAVFPGDTVALTNRVRAGVVFRGWFVVDADNRIVSMRDALPASNEIVTDVVTIPDNGTKILINTFDSGYLTETKIRHTTTAKRLKISPDEYYMVRDDVDKLISSVQNTGLCWDWWIRAIDNDGYGNVYIGYVDEDGYIGALKRYTDGRVEYARIGKSYNNDDHNGAAVHILNDGRVLVIAAHGHSNDNRVMVYRSKRAYSVADGFDDFSFELTYPGYTYYNTYSQCFEYNGVLYNFMRVVGRTNSTDSGGWGCVKSSDNGETWTFHTCIAYPDPYLLFVPVKGDISKIRVICANNPSSGHSDYRGGFINLANNTVTDLSGSVIGRIQPIAGPIDPTSAAPKNAMTFIANGTQYNSLGRLLDCAVTPENETVILVARANVDASNWEYKVVKDGVETKVGESGVPFGGAESSSGLHTYIGGAAFVETEDTILYSKAVEQTAEGRHELHIVDGGNDRIVKRSDKLLIRPIYKAGIVAAQSGVYGGFNTFWDWHLSPVFINV